MIDRYHLRYFLAVIDTGNFSRAAIACNVSQPTLSVGIAKLEQQLGCALFHRTNKRVEITQAGGRLATQARAIEAGFAQAERDVAGRDATRKVRLGVLSSTPRHWLGAIFRRHRAGAPGERLEVVEGREQDLAERLVRGRIDLALSVVRPDDNRFRHRALFTEGYALALPITHALAGRVSIAPEELVNEPMIVRRHCEALAATSRFFTTRGVRPFFSARTTNDDRALSYVGAGLGITVMPDGFGDPTVSRARLQGFELVRHIGLLFGAHVDIENQAYAAFIALLGAGLDEARNIGVH